MDKTIKINTFQAPTKTAVNIKIVRGLDEKLRGQATKMRGFGVGKLLFARIFKIAKENSFKYVRLEVINTNNQAHSLFKRLGFSDTKEIKYGLFTARAGFSSVFSMKKELDNVPTTKYRRNS